MVDGPRRRTGIRVTVVTQPGADGVGTGVARTDTPTVLAHPPMFARHTPAAAGPAGSIASVSVSATPRRPVTPRGHGGASSVLRPGVATNRQAAPSSVQPRSILAVAAGGTQLSLFGPRLVGR